MARIGYTGFSFRETRGGTPDRLSALSMRGQGGVRLHIGEGRYAMMTEADAALPVSERASLVSMRKGVEIAEIEVSAATVSQTTKIELPEMINYIGLPFKFMKGIATGGQFAELVKAGYEIKGHNGDELKAIIANESNAGKGTGYAALLDGRALAEELNRQNPGRKFRVPFDPELLKLNELVGNRLSDRNFYIWTETKYSEGAYVLRRPDDALRSIKLPENRYDFSAVRLVEDR